MTGFDDIDPIDRCRLSARLRELEEIDALMRRPGTLAAPGSGRADAETAEANSPDRPASGA